MHPLLPAFDPLIARKYSVGTVDQKSHNKTALQRKLGWPAEPRRPMVALPLGMTDKLGGALFLETLPGILSLPVEILVLGKGSEKYGAAFTKLAKEQPHRVHIVAEKETEIHAMYAAADLALFLTQTSEREEMEICLRYGVVPVAPEGTATLDDYDPVQETGNAFLFSSPTPWNVFAQLVRAMETYKFPYDWRTIQRHGMETATHTERSAS